MCAFCRTLEKWKAGGFTDPREIVAALDDPHKPVGERLASSLFSEFVSALGASALRLKGMTDTYPSGPATVPATFWREMEGEHLALAVKLSDLARRKEAGDFDAPEVECECSKCPERDAAFLALTLALLGRRANS